jgi:hypothetical protein
MMVAWLQRSTAVAGRLADVPTARMAWRHDQVLRSADTRSGRPLIVFREAVSWLPTTDGWRKDGDD